MPVARDRPKPAEWARLDSNHGPTDGNCALRESPNDAGTPPHAPCWAGACRNACSRSLAWTSGPTGTLRFRRMSGVEKVGASVQSRKAPKNRYGRPGSAFLAMRLNSTCLRSAVVHAPDALRRYWPKSSGAFSGSRKPSR